MAQRFRRARTTRVVMDGPNRMVRYGQGSSTIIEATADEVRWATRTYVTDDLLARNAEGRKANRRAPLGDAHGAWQKVADVPLALIFEKIPHDAWEDKKAWAKVLNDPEVRYFRADGDYRRF